MLMQALEMSIAGNRIQQLAVLLLTGVGEGGTCVKVYVCNHCGLPV